MSVEVIIVGGGVVGLACAARMAANHAVLVLEQRAAVGQEISSRNSQVIHAGLYYPTDSLKARLCVEGRQALYERCRARGIPHRQTGKYVVAAESGDVDRIERLHKQALANGAGVGEILSGAEVGRREPRIRALAALESPQSGIVDAHALISSYQAELESHGGQVALQTKVIDLVLDGSTWRVVTRGADGDVFSVEAHAVVNAAGLRADSVAEFAGLDVDQLGYRQKPCKGDYFSVAPRCGTLCEHLIYPVPVPGGLGIHITMDLGGRFRLGPDVDFVDTPHYEVDPAKASVFAAAVRRYLPELRTEDISPDFAGIRPKLSGPEGAFRDYVIEEASPHAAPGLINLLGIESPGLTSAWAIANRVAEKVANVLS